MKRLQRIERGFVLFAVLACVFGRGSFADHHEAPAAKAAPAPAAAKPAPTPEHKKLGYFVGNWTSSGDMKESPFGPAGTITTQDTCEWFDGGFAIVCRGSGKGPTGPMKSLAILGYNTDEKVYTYYGVDNTPMNMNTVPKGKVENGTWTYEDESTFMGATVASRYTIKELSPTSYSFKWQIEGEQGWNTVLEGKTTKVGAK